MEAQPMDVPTSEINIQLVVLRALEVLRTASATLTALQTYLRGQGVDPKHDADAVQLENAILTMQGVLESYADGTLMTREAGDPDQAPNAIQAEMHTVFALNRPLEVLLAAKQTAEIRLDGPGGQAQPSEQ
jgi:hypothetical protein